MNAQRPTTNAQVLLAICFLGVGSWSLEVRGVSAQQRPLPDDEELFDIVRENLSRAERETHLYIYKERRTDIHTNPFGRLGTGGNSLFEVYPSPTRRMTYRRLIQKDDKPISAAQLAQQDRQYRMRVTEVQKEISARSPADQRVLEEQAREARERRQRAVDDAIETLDFQLKGRTTHMGRRAVVLAFTGDPAARPETRQGRIAQKFNGTIYVDERANEVFYVEATSIDDISYGYGIVARLGKGTKVTLTREPVEGGLWMPTRLTMAGRGRALMLRRLVIDFSIEWFDYRRLPAESLAPFVDPRIQGEAGGRP